MGRRRDIGQVSIDRLRPSKKGKKGSNIVKNSDEIKTQFTAALSIFFQLNFNHHPQRTSFGLELLNRNTNVQLPMLILTAASDFTTGSMGDTGADGDDEDDEDNDQQVLCFEGATTG